MSDELRLRIGEVAELTDTTPRTIRYYEEKGLLTAAPERESGRHRTYTAADVDRLRELQRLRELLGVSLDELKELFEAEETRAALRREFRASEDPVRQHEILAEALRYLDRQLELVRHRRDEIAKLESELVARRRRVRSRQRELDADAAEAR